MTLTPAAVEKAIEFLAEEPDEGLRLRVKIQPGGCGGLRYALFFDERSIDGDQMTRYGDLDVVVDPESLTYLDGATVDFVDNRLLGAGFVLDIPKAQGMCACGGSFH